MVNRIEVVFYSFVHKNKILSKIIKLGIYHYYGFDNNMNYKLSRISFARQKQRICSVKL